MSLPSLVLTIPQPIPAQALTNLEGALLVPFLVGFSRLLSGRVSRSRQAAGSATLSGTLCWQEMQSRVPRLRASLEHFLGDNSELYASHSAEELAVIYTLVELCLGWMLYSLERMACLQLIGFYAKILHSAFNHSTFYFLYVRHLKMSKHPTPI